MLNRDLAELYGTETRILSQAVKRNLERIPEDFLFQLSRPEIRGRNRVSESDIDWAWVIIRYAVWRRGTDSLSRLAKARFAVTGLFVLRRPASVRVRALFPVDLFDIILTKRVYFKNGD